jgi:hypothetical protein
MADDQISEQGRQERFARGSRSALIGSKRTCSTVVMSWSAACGTRPRSGMGPNEGTGSRAKGRKDRRVEAFDIWRRDRSSGALAQDVEQSQQSQMTMPIEHRCNIALLRSRIPRCCGAACQRFSRVQPDHLYRHESVHPTISDIGRSAHGSFGQKIHQPSGRKAQSPCRSSTSSFREQLGCHASLIFGV